MPHTVDPKEDYGHWYKDRDFPEVKASNAYIIAVVERPHELERVIAIHNSLVDKVNQLTYELDKSRASHTTRIAELENIVSEARKVIAGCVGSITRMAEQIYAQHYSQNWIKNKLLSHPSFIDVKKFFELVDKK